MCPGIRGARSSATHLKSHRIRALTTLNGNWQSVARVTRLSGINSVARKTLSGLINIQIIDSVVVLALIFDSRWALHILVLQLDLKAIKMFCVLVDLNWFHGSRMLFNMIPGKHKTLHRFRELFETRKASLKLSICVCVDEERNFSRLTFFLQRQNT